MTDAQRGTYAGFPATVVPHYDGNMYEIRVPGGITCVSAEDFGTLRTNVRGDVERPDLDVHAHEHHWQRLDGTVYAVDSSD